jgi:MFS family permease
MNNPQNRLGPIRLAPGVRIGHALSFVSVAMASISLLIFLSFMQPYLLYGQINVPHDMLGRLTGNLSVMQELIVLAGAGPLGALSDRVGRPNIFAAGLLIISVSLLLLSTVTSITFLVAARVVFACGWAAITATLATVAADYPDNTARGKFLSVLLITQQIAILVLVANGAAKLPHLLAAHGMGKIEAGQITFRAAALFGLLSAALAYTGLRRPTAPASIAKTPILGALKQIAAHARAEPRFLIVLAVAFVARGDAAIMGAFLSLWAVKTATAAGLSQPAALAAAGHLLSAVTISGMATALLIGWLADRIDRIAALTIALVVAGLGNAGILLLHGIGTWPALAVVAVIAAGETGVIICGQTILGEQAPPSLRGAAIGVFSMCGSLGVLVLLALGGALFDKFSAQAPFVMLGAVNLAAGLAACAIWRRPNSAL